MKKESDMADEKKKEKRIALTFVIAVNVIIALIVCYASANYFAKQINYRYDVAEDSFSSTMNSMKQVAYGYLHTEQTFCDNWATYNNQVAEDLNINEFASFVQYVNTDSRVTSHIIYYDTMEGLWVDRDNMGKISYKGVEDKVAGAFVKARNCHVQNSHLHITSPYINPANGILSVGFCHDVNLADEKGAPVEAVLVRVLPVSELEGKWLFPTGFEKAKVALIDGKGEFIVKFDGVKQTNFFDYINSYNHLSSEELNQMKQDFEVNDEAKMRYLNKQSQDSCYAYNRLENGEEWMIIGYIAREDLEVTPLDLTIAVIIIVGFLILMFLDGAYIITINKRLKISMEETKHANEAKTRFLSSMSHDIRTPMNAIIGMTAIAIKRIDDKEQVKECLSQITRASNHLLTLVNDILDISKVESGKLSMNPTVFSLAESMGNIISIAQPHIKEKNMEFEVHARNVKHEFIFADELRIDQILINIISNAIKYTPAGGCVLVDLEQQPSDMGPNMVKLIYTISDNGIGISDEFKKKMYNSFTRDTASPINAIQGTGLGLAITKQLVDLMGGTIEVDSTLGEGTTFTVRIPISYAA